MDFLQKRQIQDGSLQYQPRKLQKQKKQAKQPKITATIFTARNGLMVTLRDVISHQPPWRICIKSAVFKPQGLPKCVVDATFYLKSNRYKLGVAPNKGLGWDSLLKME